MCNKKVFPWLGFCAWETVRYIHPATFILHVDMQDVWFSQGFEGFLLNRVCVHTGHRSTRWQTHRALVECWFSIGFTRYSVQIRVCPTVGGSSRTVSRAGPLQVFYLISQRFWWFLVNRVRIRWVVFSCQAGNTRSYTFSEGFGRLVFFWQIYCTTTCKGKLFSCYMTYCIA